MNCREFTEFLHEYLFGDLPAAERAAFEGHLAECPWCVAYLDSYRKTIQLEQAAYDIVRRPGADPAALHRALRWAEAACGLQPEDGKALNTLAMVHYRLGNFPQAFTHLALISAAFNLDRTLGAR